MLFFGFVIHFRNLHGLIFGIPPDSTVTAHYNALIRAKFHQMCPTSCRKPISNTIQEMCPIFDAI